MGDYRDKFQEHDLTVQLEIEVPERLRSDILITAFDGSYGAVWQFGWARHVETKTDQSVASPLDQIWESVEIELTDPSDSPGDKVTSRYVIDHRSIVTGLHHMINGKDKNGRPNTSRKNKELLVQAILDDDAGEIDAVLASAIVECSIWGHVVYG